MPLYRADSAEAVAALAAIERARGEGMDQAFAAADQAIAGVRAQGDRYVREQIQRFDGVAVESILIEPRPVAIDTDLAAAMEMAIDRVEAFHRRQTPQSYEWTQEGTRVAHRVTPLRRVGLYVPGGRAVYLSTLIMTAVPARIAGVPELVLATTPAAAEREELHYLARRLGIQQIYRAGGAAGVAALALGTESLRRVDKIVGPGNQYVTAAKARLMGTVGIDMLAGPTELVIIADDSARTEWVAADLAAQAEHGQDSTTISIWIGAGFDLPEATLNLVARDSEEALRIAAGIAPEHLSIHARDAWSLAARAENCGAVFCGASAPVAAGDYIAGPNHVLPTGGSARFSSPLGVYDFVKRSNIISIDEQSLQRIGPAAQKLAEFEGLPMHARSLAQRTSS